MNRTLIALAASAALIGSLTACGSQTDERVEPAASESVPAGVVEAPADEASAIASAVASTPFVTIDCVSAQVMPNDTAPQGTTIGSVTASLQPTGVPSITVGTDGTPATELGVADVQEGSGAEVQPGDTVTVNYCGVGSGTQTLFDSSWARGAPATFSLDQVIAGWQQGVPGMKVGGTRLLVIPGELAYGEAGSSGILPNETLAFVVELQAIG